MDELIDLRATLVVDSRLAGLGALPSGQALARTFDEKATGAQNSARTTLSSHIAILSDMAATFRMAGAAYRNTAAGNAASYSVQS